MSVAIFPRTVRSVHQIEITSRCNLRCVYCPSPSIVAGKYPNRLAMDMTLENFKRALEWVACYVRRQTQHELNLAGIGESTMHPQFEEFVALAREAVGPNVALTMATNGLICPESMIANMSLYGLKVWVSLHRPEKAAKALQLYKKYGMLVGVSADPSINSNTWAGQVDWIDSGNRFPCPWMKNGQVMVMADGRITTCCLDAQGIGVIGHVNDAIGSVETKPYELCRKCYQTIDSDQWNQEEGKPR